MPEFHPRKRRYEHYTHLVRTHLFEQQSEFLAQKVLQAGVGVGARGEGVGEGVGVGVGVGEGVGVGVGVGAGVGVGVGAGVGVGVGAGVGVGVGVETDGVHAPNVPLQGAIKVSFPYSSGVTKISWGFPGHCSMNFAGVNPPVLPV